MAMFNFDTARKIGLALPDVVDGTAYGAPALKLGGKILACIPTNKSAEANSVAVHIDLDLPRFGGRVVITKQSLSWILFLSTLPRSAA